MASRGNLVDWILFFVLVNVYFRQGVNAENRKEPLTCVTCSTDLDIFKNLSGVDTCADSYTTEYASLQPIEARRFGIQNITCQPGEVCSKDKTAIYTHIDGRRIWSENHTFFRRGCTPLPEGYSTPACYGRTGKSGYVINCFCNDDFCNSAQVQHTALLTLLLCSVVFWIKLAKEFI